MQDSQYQPNILVWKSWTALSFFSEMSAPYGSHRFLGLLFNIFFFLLVWFLNKPDHIIHRTVRSAGGIAARNLNLELLSPLNYVARLVSYCPFHCLGWKKSSGWCRSCQLQQLLMLMAQLQNKLKKMLLLPLHSQYRSCFWRYCCSLWPQVPFAPFAFAMNLVYVVRNCKRQSVCFLKL